MVMLKHKPRAPGNYDPNEASTEAALICRDPSLAQQHHADEADINLIVKRYTQTGVLPQAALAPLYGDFTGATSFHEAQNQIRAAVEAFNLIPADIRARFDNDPGKFVAFAEDEANHDELVRLKLRAPRKAAEKPATPPEPPAGVPARPADPTPQG